MWCISLDQTCFCGRDFHERVVNGRMLEEVSCMVDRSRAQLRVNNDDNNNTDRFIAALRNALGNGAYTRPHEEDANLGGNAALFALCVVHLRSTNCMLIDRSLGNVEEPS